VARLDEHAAPKPAFRVETRAVIGLNYIDMVCHRTTGVKTSPVVVLLLPGIENLGEAVFLDAAEYVAPFTPADLLAVAKLITPFEHLCGLKGYPKSFGARPAKGFEIGFEWAVSRSGTSRGSRLR